MCLLYYVVMSHAQEFLELSAHYHAATASLVRLAAQVDAGDEWQGVGLQSSAHWMSINAGFETWTAAELVRVGHALEGLPLISAAFAEGRLSLDKVRALISVATHEDENVWLSIAASASATQLARICRGFRRATVVDDPERSARQHAERRLRAWWREDGMLDLVATLPPEDGRLVLNAIEDAMETPVAGLRAARRADALTRVCARWLAGSATDNPRRRAPRELVIHVDAETLINKDHEGRCHLEDGPAVSAALARRVGCDAEVVTVIERGGAPLDLSKHRRGISAKQRRALQIRDATCRFPGCSVPARETDGHHIRHWIDGGLTELDNLVSLCAFHHQRHHEGEFEISRAADGSLEFRSRRGPVGPATASKAVATDGAAWLRQLSALAGRTITAETARAGDAGERCDQQLVVELLAHQARRTRSRDGPD
jgi:Domain of unknown function (DUF222)